MSSSTFNPEQSNPLSKLLKYADKTSAPKVPAAPTQTKQQLLDIWNHYLENIFIAQASFEDYAKHSVTLQNTGLTDAEKQDLYRKAQQQAAISASSALKKFNKFLIQNDIEKYATIISSVQDLLHGAVTQNNIKKLQEALSLIETLDLPSPAKKALLNAKFYRLAGENARPALVQASTNGSDLNLIELLFASGADADLLIPENKTPLFFEVCNNRLSPINPNAESLPYKTLKQHIDLFLSNGYNINLLNSAKLNFLSFLFKNSYANQLSVTVNMAVNKIVELVDKGQISPASFKKFCEETPQVKLFPELVDRYYALPLVSNAKLAYPDEAERQHYLLHSLMINTLAFATYTKNRVQHTYFSASKLSKLEDLITRLQSLHMQAFGSVREMIDHRFKAGWENSLPETAAKLNKLLNELTEVTNISRISLFSNPSSFADWNIFKHANVATFTALDKLIQAPSVGLSA